MKGLKESFRLIYSNTHLRTHETLPLRPIIASHKILTFLKGQFTINKKHAGATLYYDMVLSRQYWNRRKMGVSAILKFATASLSGMISRKSTYPPYCRSFSRFYEFILRKWRHFRIPIWRKRTISMISSHSEAPVANFNIVNLNKSVEEVLPDKKAFPDHNLQAIDLNLAQIVAFYMAYNLWNFQLDSLKIKAWPIKKAKA